MTEVSDATKELAQSLEIWDMLVELLDKEKPPTTERKQFLRNEITETVLECYFDAAAVEAEAEREYVALDAIRQELMVQTDRRVGLNNAANFMISGTMNTVSAGLSLNESAPPFAENFLQLLSGAVSTSMSSYALRQARGSRIFGLDEPTVLSELFGRPTDARTAYPESVWRFLHLASVEDRSKTRVQRLEQLWIQRHHLEPHGSRTEQQKIDLVCGIKFDRKKMSIDDLTDNIAMISDVSEMAARMTHHLRDILYLIDADLVLK